MTQATVTSSATQPHLHAFVMNDDAESNLSRKYTLPRFGQINRPRSLDSAINIARVGLRERSTKIRGTVSGQVIATAVDDESDEWWWRLFDQLERDLDGREYAKRIAMLIEEAEFEGIEVNGRSLLAFWAFVGAGTRTQLGYAFLTDGGEVSVEWRTGDDNHFELRFLGDNRVNYVFFKKQPGETHVSIGYGTEVLSTIRKRIILSGFGELVFS